MWQSIYRQLERAFPDFQVESWWGMADPFSRVVGSILVQNTNWSNVVKALERMDAAGILFPEKLLLLSAEELQEIIRPAGFQRAKSACLLQISRWIVQKGGMEVIRKSNESGEQLRRQLLAMKGIGEETADTILAYALDRPSISGDAYTRRLWLRLTGESCTYGQIRMAIQAEIEELQDLQRLHGLIVEHGKEFCKKRQPQCGKCLFSEKCRSASIPI
ncbi:hypothetical protein NDK47_09645 [Brevibacillus ruminantium]|uniref:HhH-GPD domain-containing protein n=1 Tax=Brevibacillus ruminantium TaxID=2950604 RepID=A0ABY4WKX3_9BACL|nr:hypothetical protein [Brevibacillus ruminantium]USG67509.1 hypothetical protein NDK47_09645 [Brevibacillus ruminantium]